MLFFLVYQRIAKCLCNRYFLLCILHALHFCSLFYLSRQLGVTLLFTLAKMHSKKDHLAQSKWSMNISYRYLSMLSIHHVRCTIKQCSSSAKKLVSEAFTSLEIWIHKHSIKYHCHVSSQVLEWCLLFSFQSLYLLRSAADENIF